VEVGEDEVHGEVQLPGTTTISRNLLAEVVEILQSLEVVDPLLVAQLVEEGSVPTSLNAVTMLMPPWDATCVICLDYLKVGVFAPPEIPITVLTRCGHYFHRDCLARWTETCLHTHLPLTCPMCRTTY